MALGLFIINEGNRAAGHLRSRFQLEGYDVRPAGRLTVWNLLVMRRRRRVPGVLVTTATAADVLGAWDTGAFHATQVVSYSAAATIARGVHAALRTILREGAPLPKHGEAFRSLTITSLAIRDRDPRVLRALLSAVNNDHVSQGFHLMHLGATVGEDWAPALRGWLRQRFSSSLYALTRTGDPEPPGASLSNLYLDLSII